jgi:predicted Zn finger-like uncharacterized protein
MRIVCPNCAAEYEVDAALIPDTGRDVQCSSCGHAWFVVHPDQIAADESEQALFEPPAPPQDAPAPPQPRPVDQAILDVLREEAERETAQRQAEARTVVESRSDADQETSEGFGADTNPVAAEPPMDAVSVSPVAERIARLKGQAPQAAQKTVVDDPTAAKRSELLPEIDEINSSLRPASEKRPGAAAAVAKTMPRKGGFGRGFMVGLLIWVVILMAYTLAPELSRQIPSLAPALSGFVAFIDGLRAAIAEMSGQLIDTLGKLTQ